MFIKTVDEVKPLYFIPKPTKNMPKIIHGLLSDTIYQLIKKRQYEITGETSTQWIYLQDCVSRGTITHEDAKKCCNIGYVPASMSNRESYYQQNATNKDNKNMKNTTVKLNYADVQDLIEFLPSGSGFNCDYSVSENKETFWIYSAFQCTNEHGCYDGFQDFKIILSKDISRIQNFKLQFCNGHSKADRYMLREYMDDSIYIGIQDYTFAK